MPRLPRFRSVDFAQHVTHRGNDRIAVFRDDLDRTSYLAGLADALVRHDCRLHAYALMSNHVHLLVSQSAPGAIGEVMQTLGRRYVRAFNRRHARTGTLWEGRYHASLVDSASYLLACYRYIDLNPLRAGLVANPVDYHWSSCRANALGERDPLVVPHDEFLTLGDSMQSRAESYRALLNEPLPEPIITTIRSASRSGWGVGNREFHETVSRSDRRSDSSPPGPRARSSDAMTHR